MKIADIKSQCSAAYQLALREAKEGCGKGFYQSRGRYIYVIRGDEVIAGGGEEWDWKGTKADIQKAIDTLGEGNYGYVLISGGIDFAEEMVGFREGWYTPHVADWDVLVFERKKEGVQA
jgi:hypothetical protein